MIQNKTKHYTQTIYTLPQPTPASEIYLHVLGCFQSLGNFHFEQTSSTIAIHAVFDGEGEIHHAGKTFLAGPGDLFIFHKGEHYRYNDKPSKPWKYSYTIIRGSQAENLFNKIGLSAKNPILHLSPANPFWTKLRQMEQEFKEGVRSSFTPIRVAWEIVELLEMASRPSEFKNKPDPAEVARNLIDQSLQCITDINTLSQGLNISRTTLFRLFKNRYGLSIKQYSEHVRFERIETLLRRRELPISEIARIGGFNDPLYFSRAFRKRYGKPPSQMYARPKKGAVVSQ